MTLQEAYQGWQEQEQNRKLFTKTREAFRKAWFQLPTNKPCEYYTKEILGEALAATREVESNKAKAASVMIHVLTFANFAEPGDNPKPEFTYDDLMKFTQAPVKKPTLRQRDTENKSVKSVESVGEKNADQTTPAEDGSIKTQSPTQEGKAAAPIKKSTSAKPNASGDQAAASLPKGEGQGGARIIRKVDDDICQLDLRTLEVIKRWPHALRIKQELGIHNVVRAIERCGVAGGFYWSYSKDLDTFAARLAARQQHNAQAHADHCAKMRAAKNPQAENKPQDTQKDTEEKPKSRRKPKPKSGDDPKTAEVGTKVSVSPTGERPASHHGQFQLCPASGPEDRRSAASKALDVFTDDELFAELDRRGWFGYFSRTEIVTIGTK
jgi:hypothetical protein